MKCKPNREFIFTFTTSTTCFIKFNPRQIWSFFISGSQVEIWRDNVSIRMDIDDFRSRFKECEEE